MEMVTRHFVRPQHLNHHQSLYAGVLSEWMTEAAFIEMAKAVGHTDHYVLAAIKEINVVKSVYSGTILELQSSIKHVGTTSVEFEVCGEDFITKEQYCSGSLVFVTVDDAGKKCPHGLSMD